MRFVLLILKFSSHLNHPLWKLHHLHHLQYLSRRISYFSDVSDSFNSSQIPLPGYYAYFLYTYSLAHSIFWSFPLAALPLFCIPDPYSSPLAALPLAAFRSACSRACYLVYLFLYCPLAPTREATIRWPLDFIVALIYTHTYLRSV